MVVVVALVELLALVVAVTLFGLGLVHVYWALGGTRYRQYATPRVGGRPTAEPGGVAFVAVAGALWLAAVVALSRVVGAQGIHGTQGFHGAGGTWAWIFCGLFAFRSLGDFRLIGLFCRRADAAHRRFERRISVPICLFLAVSFARLAILPAAA